MSTKVLNVLIEQLKAIKPDKVASLSVESAGSITLQSLQLDSLDTLQFAMEIEDALSLEIEIVDFAETSTLVELAAQLAQPKKV